MAEKAKKTATKKSAEKKGTKTSVSVSKKQRGISRLALRTLVRPIVSEKTAHQADSGVIVFEVAMDANRIAVRQAFKEVYGVLPEKVNVIRVRGKKKRIGLTTGKRSDYKKALVYLPEGKTVDVFEGV
ncbi:MAG: 50S ribosomal protein L23 [bacterium]|nr:50S ribosomal protein L23 [bacterium]